VSAGFVQIQVTDDQFGTLRFQALHGGVEIAEGEDLVIFPAQHFGERLHHGHFIIKQEDFCHAGSVYKLAAGRKQLCALVA
jgi:hypothetical protein